MARTDCFSDFRVGAGGILADIYRRAFSAGAGTSDDARVSVLFPQAVKPISNNIAKSMETAFLLIGFSFFHPPLSLDY